MGRIWNSQEGLNQALLLEALEATVFEKLTSQRKGVHESRNLFQEVWPQAELIQSSGQNVTVKPADVVTHQDRPTQHPEEGYEGDQGFSERAGEHRPVMEKQTLASHTETRNPGRPGLHRPTGNHEEVKSVTFTHCGQLDDIT